MYTLYRENFGSGYKYSAEPIESLTREEIEKFRAEDFEEKGYSSVEFITYFNIKKLAKLQLVYGQINVIKEESR